jgi:hypothetical protein
MPRVICLCLALILPQAASAQSMPCAPRERMLEVVIDRLGGVRQATGTAGHGGTGAQMELFADPDGGWSLILHLPDGRSCLLANGTEFQATGGLQPARGRPA